jgi:hypothetical protein
VARLNGGGGLDARLKGSGGLVPRFMGGASNGFISSEKIGRS